MLFSDSRALRYALHFLLLTAVVVAVYALSGRLPHPSAHLDPGRIIRAHGLSIGRGRATTPTAARPPAPVIVAAPAPSITAAPVAGQPAETAPPAAITAAATAATTKEAETSTETAASPAAFDDSTPTSDLGATIDEPAAPPLPEQLAARVSLAAPAPVRAAVVPAPAAAVPAAVPAPEGRATALISAPDVAFASEALQTQSPPALLPTVVVASEPSLKASLPASTPVAPAVAAVSTPVATPAAPAPVAPTPQTNLQRQSHSPQLAEAPVASAGSGQAAGGDALPAPRPAAITPVVAAPAPPPPTPVLSPSVPAPAMAARAPQMAPARGGCGGWQVTNAGPYCPGASAAPASPTLSAPGHYCSLANGGGQVWVPAGASGAGC